MSACHEQTFFFNYNSLHSVKREISDTPAGAVMIWCSVKLFWSKAQGLTHHWCPWYLLLWRYCFNGTPLKWAKAASQSIHRCVTNRVFPLDGRKKHWDDDLRPGLVGTITFSWLKRWQCPEKDHTPSEEPWMHTWKQVYLLLTPRVCWTWHGNQ